MSRAFVFMLFVVGIYIALPAAMVWGWARWSKRSQSRTVLSILSLIGFAPNDDQKIWNFLRSSPEYQRILNVPVFPPNMFPQGPPSGIPPAGPPQIPPQE